MQAVVTGGQTIASRIARARSTTKTIVPITADLESPLQQPTTALPRAAPATALTPELAEAVVVTTTGRL